MTNPEIERIYQLREELHTHNYNYYVLNSPVISDIEFDHMMRELQDLEAKYPETYDENSPTMRVGSDINKDFVQVEHRYPMLSLGNTYSEEEVTDFYERVRKSLNEDFEICCEMKFDGTSISLTYENGKLVRAVRGTVFDVAVDLRTGSETYGKWFGVVLSAENKKQFLIPEGFAHGFLVLSDEAEFCYKVNDFWHPNDEGGMAWNDPEIGIEWPEVKGEYKGTASAEGYTLADGTVLNLSDKDQKWLGLKDTFKF